MLHEKNFKTIISYFAQKSKSLSWFFSNNMWVLQSAVMGVTTWAASEERL